MNISDKNTIMSIYDSLTTNKIQELNYYSLKYEKKVYIINMNLEEVIFIQKLRDLMNKKQDFEIKFGYKG